MTASSLSSLLASMAAFAVLAACGGEEAAHMSETPSERAPAEAEEATTEEARTEEATEDGVTDHEAPETPEWRRVAESVPQALSLDDILEGLTPTSRAAVEGVLERMEASGRGVDAVTAAGELAEAGAPGINDGSPMATGMPAGSAAIHDVGLLLLQGMLVESATADPSTVPALAAAVCTMTLPAWYNGGGLADDSRHRWTLRHAVHATLPEGERPPTPDCPE